MAIKCNPGSTTFVYNLTWTTMTHAAKWQPPGDSFPPAHTHTHPPWRVITRHTPFQFLSWGKMCSVEWMKLGNYETNGDQEGAQSSKQWGECTSGRGSGVVHQCEHHTGAPCAAGMLVSVFLSIIVSGGPNTELRQMVLSSLYRWGN